MKKTIITFAVALATIITANAQEFKVGVKAGFLLSNLSFAESPVAEGITRQYEKFNTAFKPGFHFGGFVEYGFNKHWFVEAGVDYAFQGAKIKSLEMIEKDSYGDVVNTNEMNFKNAKLNAQQLNVPIWVKYDIAGFRPKVGVNLGFLTKTEFKGELEQYAGTSLDSSLTPDKKFDLSLGFGAEYNLPFGLFFDASFNLGLTELSNKGDEENNDNLVFTTSDKFKNRVIQVGVGYKF
ncbi:hypothetical protein RCZ04_07650 [Capnocytophaga sp. HP1101]